ncbi:MAG TPA: DinB family protein, partial [Terriglobales bacterium]|nr:DinB family protein [Terriglobales bacterium]
DSLAHAAEDVLQQGLALLTDLNDEIFAALAPSPYNASIGQHFRHVLDHFLCLEAGLLAGEIDYDHRTRDPRLETDLAFARSETERIIRVLKNYQTDLLNQPCSVRYTVGYGKSTPMLIASVLGRELAFCIGHAVHHYAIIRLLCDSIGVGVVPEFGVAPSTLKHRREQMVS